LVDFLLVALAMMLLSFTFLVYHFEGELCTHQSPYRSE